MAVLTVAFGDVSTLRVDDGPVDPSDTVFTDDDGKAVIVTLGVVTGAEESLSRPVVTQGEWLAREEITKRRFVAVGLAAARAVTG